MLLMFVLKIEFTCTISITFQTKELVTEILSNVLVRHRIWHGEVPKDPADGRQYYEVAITDGIRNCTGAFVDTQWVLTSAKCLQK